MSVGSVHRKDRSPIAQYMSLFNANAIFIEDSINSQVNVQNSLVKC